MVTARGTAQHSARQRWYSAAVTETTAATSSYEAALGTVLEVLRDLARELGGARAAGAVAPQASLERQVGLGSLERVELMLRLEAAFGRRLDDRCLQIDTPEGLARALLEAESGEAAARPRPGRAAVPREPAPLPEAATVHGALWLRAQAEPERLHAWLREDDGREVALSYGGLFAEASSVAAGLRARGVGRGDTVALVLPTGLDFLRTFQGILLLGAIPVPLYPPVRLDRLEEYALRQAGILANAEARLLVTVERARPVVGLLRPRVPSLRAVATADELAAEGGPWPAPEGAGADPAFIQYTSGSTGMPKGVLLTHDNLLANIRAIAAGLRLAPTDVGQTWLPLYHDMGLIGSWLFCIVHGVPIDIQSPLAFLARPERWLWAIHERQATMSAAPNFAYELCVRRIPDRALEGLDLSSWRCALNGAEPVSPDTMDRFARRFAPYGFRREAFMPVYGLAESAVGLCFPPPGRGPRVTLAAREPFSGDGRVEAPAPGEKEPLRFVSVGTALPGHEVRILDDDGAELPSGRVGRLVFRGPSSMAGYYRNAEATAEVAVGDGWLDSGDLAFVADGEVHVAGRRKDLIIKGGRNLVPQEVEEAAASVEGIRKGCVAAFGVAQAALGTEALVVVAETRETDGPARERLAAAVVERVGGVTGVPPDDVRLVAPGVVAKTPSGKVRRAATRDLYLRGALGAERGLSPGARSRLFAAVAVNEARRRLRAVPGLLYAGAAAAAVAAVGLLAWVLAVVLPRTWAPRTGRFCARLFFRLLGQRLTVEGLERLAVPGPLVLCSNHASYADVPALMALLPLDFAFVAKAEVRRWPFVGSFVRRTRQLTVDRWDTEQSLNDARTIDEALHAGRNVLFFPEGTFTPATGLRPFRLGAFKSAAAAEVAILPLALQGTRHVLRGGGWRPRRGHIHLWIGPPLRPEGEGWHALVDLRDRTASAIAARCGEPRLDLLAAGPVRP
jgi:1-acyl-sn-glycerol-3-phosphate acyltransferase